MLGFIVPAKLTAFGWRLCQAFLPQIFAYVLHCFLFAIQHLTDDHFEWLLTILFTNGNLMHRKDYPVLDSKRSKPAAFPTRTRWNPPPRGLYKVNFGGIFDCNGKKGGIGIIIRDNEGFVWGGAAVKMDGVTDESVGEAMAAVKALEVAREMGCGRVILESDCVGILSELLMKGVDEGKRVMGEVEECYIHHIQREGNQVANLIARHSLVGEEDLFWQHDYPNFIHQAIMFDAINV
ncbi:hypothetical protein V6N12_014784 [Hibiscus sabdariffa]|uniref:RNase H type-1 domain-containing protein n=1 Tax=Hibiscus sabdariffa TaxID=183260 RepID=A0ABR2DM22_9ROSI